MDVADRAFTRPKYKVSPVGIRSRRKTEAKAHTYCYGTEEELHQIVVQEKMRIAHARFVKHLSGRRQIWDHGIEINISYGKTCFKRHVS